MTAAAAAEVAREHQKLAALAADVGERDVRAHPLQRHHKAAALRIEEHVGRGHFRARHERRRRQRLRWLAASGLVVALATGLVLLHVFYMPLPDLVLLAMSRLGIH